MVELRCSQPPQPLLPDMSFLPHCRSFLAARTISSTLYFLCQRPIWTLTPVPKLIHQRTISISKQHILSIIHIYQTQANHQQDDPAQPQRYGWRHHIYRTILVILLALICAGTSLASHYEDRDMPVDRRGIPRLVQFYWGIATASMVAILGVLVDILFEDYPRIRLYIILLWAFVAGLANWMQ